MHHMMCCSVNLVTEMVTRVITQTMYVYVFDNPSSTYIRIPLSVIVYSVYVYSVYVGYYDT